MSLGMKALFLSVITGEFILGMLGNGLIALVNCMDWVKKGKISSADFILFNLATARIIQLWVTLLGSFMWLLPQNYHNGKLLLVFAFLWTLSHHLTIWFTTCLSIFYFLKIATFSHSLFTWLKWRVKRVVLVIFLGSFFLLSVDLAKKGTVSDLWINAYSVPGRNWTLHLYASTIFRQDYIILSLIFVIPFLLSLTSLLLLFLSLLRHTKNWQLNSPNPRDSCTEAHERAMKMVAIFLLLFMIYCISILSASWIFVTGEMFQANLVAMMLSAIFLSGHSFVIIFGNRKFRQVLLRLLCYLKRS
nr:unnamed protein product [Sorex araneus]